MTKKVLFLFLFAVTLNILFACGNSESTGDINNNDGFIYDTMGYNFIFLVHQHVPNTPELAPELGFSNIGDKILQRYDEVENAFNLTMDVRVSDTTNSNILASMISGDKVADLQDSNAKILIEGLEKDVYIPFNSIDYEIDYYSGKYGTKNQIDAVTFNGDVYGLRNAYWGSPWPSFKGVVFFNPKILVDSNQSSPFEYVEKEEWTWDTFESILDAVKREATVDTPAVYGLPLTTSGIAVNCAVLSNGASPIVYNENTGKYEFGLNDPKALEAFAWINKLVKDKQTAVFINDWWEKSSIGFIEGNYVFLPENAWIGFMEGVNHLSTDMKEPFGWTYFPTGPRGIYGETYTSITYEKRYMLLPTNPDGEYDLILQVMDFMFEPLPGDNENSWKENLERSFFYEDNGSFQSYIKMAETAKTDYSTIVKDAVTNEAKGILGIYQKFLRANSSINEIIETYSDFIQNEIDTKLNNIQNP